MESTIVGNLIPNPDFFFIYIEISLSVISFLNELELICLHTTISLVSTLLDGFNYLTLIILFNINHLFVYSGYKYCYLTLIILFNITHSFTLN